MSMRRRRLSATVMACYFDRIMYHTVSSLCVIALLLVPGLPLSAASAAEPLRETAVRAFGRRQGIASPLADEHARTMRGRNVHRGTQWGVHAANTCAQRVRGIVAKQRIAEPLVVVLTADGGQFSQLLARALPTAAVVSFHSSAPSMRAHVDRRPKLAGDVVGGVFTEDKLDRLWSLPEFFDVLVISPGALDSRGKVDRMLGRLISLSRWTLVADAWAAATPAVAAARGGARVDQAVLRRAIRAVRGQMTPYLRDPTRKVDPRPSVYVSRQRKYSHYKFEFGVRELEVKVSEVPIRGTAGDLEPGRLFEVQTIRMLQQKRHDWDDIIWWKYYSLELASAGANAVVGRLQIRDTVAIPRAGLNLGTLLGIGPPLDVRIGLLANLLEVPPYPDVAVFNYVLCCGGRLQRIDKEHHEGKFRNDKNRAEHAFSDFSGHNFLDIAADEVAKLAKRCGTCTSCDRCNWKWAAEPCSDCLACAKCIRSTVG